MFIKILLEVSFSIPNVNPLKLKDICKTFLYFLGYFHDFTERQNIEL